MMFKQKRSQKRGWLGIEQEEAEAEPEIEQKETKKTKGFVIFVFFC
jgi:hypothetical protein